MLPPCDWATKKLLIVSIAILSIVLGSIGLTSIGVNIPILRPVVGLTFLLFVPGLLILRILRVHNIGLGKCVIYTIGLSIGCIYQIGLIINGVLPFIGITKPLSVLYIATNLTIFTILLVFITYKCDKDFQPCQDVFYFRDLLKPTHLFIIIMFILPILGTQFVNAYHNQMILILYLSLISYIIALVAFDSFPEDIYPLAIFVITIGLLLQYSLISPTTWGSDIQTELYFQDNVIKNGYWDYNSNNFINTCLSIVILCPIYSLITSIDGVWLFKIIYPTVFAFVPLALFYVFKEQIGPKRAFIADVFFLSMPLFAETMISHARQEVAEIFLALLLLLMQERTFSKFQRAFLGVIFLSLLPLSHYGLSYICIGFFVTVLFFSFLIRYPISSIYLRKKIPFIQYYCEEFATDIYNTMLTPRFVAILTIFSLSWFIYTSKGSVFDIIVNISKSIYISFEDFFSASTRETAVLAGLGGGFSQALVISKTFRVLQYSTELFIAVGFLVILFEPRCLKGDFFAFSCVSGLILFFCVFIPSFSSFFGIERFYHIALFFLSPLFVIGGEVTLQGVMRLKNLFIRSYAKLKSISMLNDEYNYMGFLSLFVLIPYFLFASGFVYVFSGSGSTIALGPYEFDYNGLLNNQEVSSAQWAWKTLPDDATMYADRTGYLLLSQVTRGRVQQLPSRNAPLNLSNHSYLLFRSWNIEHNEITLQAYQGVNHVYVDMNIKNRPILSKEIEQSISIYNNGGSRVMKMLST